MELFVTPVKKKVAALISIGAVAILAGCASTSAAFTVGKSTTSVSDIQSSVNNILSARKGVDTTGMNLQTGVALVESQVQFLLISQLLVDTAKSVGITIAPSEVAAAKAAALKQVGGQALFSKALVGASIDPKNVDLYFTSVVYSQKLSAYVQKNGATAANTGEALTTLVSGVATKEGVTINPRYGKWDPKTATLVPADASSGAVKSNK
jgi:hypothetical protein